MRKVGRICKTRNIKTTVNNRQKSSISELTHLSWTSALVEPLLAETSCEICSSSCALGMSLQLSLVHCSESSPQNQLPSSLSTLRSSANNNALQRTTVILPSTACAYVLLIIPLGADKLKTYKQQLGKSFVTLTTYQKYSSSNRGIFTCQLYCNAANPPTHRLACAADILIDRQEEIRH